MSITQAERCAQVNHQVKRLDLDRALRGDPDPFEIEDTGDLEPLPPLPPPRFEFHRDKLRLSIRDFGFLDLAAVTDRKAQLRFSDAQGKTINPDAGWMKANHRELIEAIDSAGWEVFWNRKFYRSLLFGYHEDGDFSVFETMKNGAELDWHLGVVRWPTSKPLLKAAVPIFDIEPGEDSGELLASRYLCRGGGWLITGPTGVGKSSLVMQMAFSWALGNDCFGLEPADDPLSILVVQAENDAGDLIEQRQGIVEGMDLDGQEQAVLNEMVAVVTIDDATGAEFFARLARHIRDWHPDIVILDPLLAFVGADISRQDEAAKFLRHHLNPLIHRADVGVILVHHTGKPKQDNGRPAAANSADYDGLGSSELSNWARAIANLRIEDRAFSLTLGKRGKRSGVTDQFGANRIWLQHSANRIFWEPAEPEQVQNSAKRVKTADDLFALLPLSPARTLKNSLLDSAKNAGFGEKRARTFLDELIDAGRVFIHREKRAGTNPLQYVARHPAEPQAEIPGVATQN